MIITSLLFLLIGLLLMKASMKNTAKLWIVKRFLTLSKFLLFLATELNESGRRILKEIRDADSKNSN